MSACFQVHVLSFYPASGNGDILIRSHTDSIFTMNHTPLYHLGSAFYLTFIFAAPQGYSQGKGIFLTQAAVFYPVGCIPVSCLFPHICTF